jgi:hypothetical protein
MSIYIDKNGRKEMEILLEDYFTFSKDEKTLYKADRTMNVLFTKYIDKIINGVIYSPKFKFNYFYDPEDLFQVGRMEVFKSLSKGQWKKERGNIFNFLTTVVKRNLTWFTLNQNKKNAKYSDVDFDLILSGDSLSFSEDLDNPFLYEFIFMEMRIFFKARGKMEKLCEIFIEYLTINQGKRFVKKDFIEYCGTYTFSPSLCHAFFANLKKIKNVSRMIGE